MPFHKSIGRFPVPANSPRPDAVARGQRLKIARIKAGLGQQEVAEKLGIDPKTVSNHERGVTAPGGELSIAYAALYGTTASHLMSGALTPADLAAAEAVSRVGVIPEPRTRHERNYPQRVRVWLKEFELELTKAGADEEELQAAIALVTAPEVFSYFSRTGSREHSEDDVLIGMEALAQVVRRELKKRGRKTR